MYSGIGQLGGREQAASSRSSRRVRIYIYIYISIHRFMYICIYVCMSLSLYIYMYMYVRIIYTHNVTHGANILCRVLLQRRNSNPQYFAIPLVFHRAAVSFALASVVLIYSSYVLCL